MCWCMQPYMRYREVQVRLFEGPDGEGLVSSHQHACCTVFRPSTIHIAGQRGPSGGLAEAGRRAILGQQPGACRSGAEGSLSGEPGRAKDELGSPEAGVSRPTAWPEPGAWSLGPS